MSDSTKSTEAIRNEIELARALTAIILAVRLELSEKHTEEAYKRILGEDIEDIAI